jgi:hypothetical protein
MLIMSHIDASKSRSALILGAASQGRLISIATYVHHFQLQTVDTETSNDSAVYQVLVNHHSTAPESIFPLLLIEQIYRGMAQMVFSD